MGSFASFVYCVITIIASYYDWVIDVILSYADYDHKIKTLEYKINYYVLSLFLIYASSWSILRIVRAFWPFTDPYYDQFADLHP